MAFKKDDVIIIEPKDMFVGNPKAPVTLMEFGEYESEVCAKANEVVKLLLEKFKDDIRFNFRHFPLTKIHQRSLKAGEAAVAAGQHGKFWEMHNVLFANRRNLGTTSLKLHSREAGVQNKHFLDELVNAVYGWQVQGDISEGQKMGVKDVPTFFINGEMYKGRISFEDMSKAIADAIRKAKRKAPEKKAAAKPAAKKVVVKKEITKKAIAKPVVKKSPAKKAPAKKTATKKRA
jgi:protein-disulfide isomerase